MRLILSFTVALLVLASSAAIGGDSTGHERVRAAITAAVVDRFGGADDVDVELLQAPADVAPTPLTATPAIGARLGQPVRFVLTPGSGRPFTVLARITAIVGHAVAARPLARDAALTREDVEWRHARIDGVPLQAMPALDEILNARTRRTVAAGEVLNRAVLVRPFAVRAGDTVAMTVRTGAIEVRGVGTAVSSGFVGDVIRIVPPGTRQPSRARITGPAAVELLQ